MKFRCVYILVQSRRKVSCNTGLSENFSILFCATKEMMFIRTLMYDTVNESKWTETRTCALYHCITCPSTVLITFWWGWGEKTYVSSFSLLKWFSDIHFNECCQCYASSLKKINQWCFFLRKIIKNLIFFKLLYFQIEELYAKM